MPWLKQAICTPSFAEALQKSRTKFQTAETKKKIAKQAAVIFYKLAVKRGKISQKI